MSIFDQLQRMVSTMKKKSGPDFTTLNGVQFATVRDEAMAEEGITSDTLFESISPHSMEGITFFTPGLELPVTNEDSASAENTEGLFEVA